MIWVWLYLWQLDPAVRMQVLDSIASLSSFQVEFEQETYSDYFDPTQAAGSLIVQRPGKMRMEYTMGERRLAISDGDVFKEYDYDAETLNEMDQADLQEEPLVRIFLYGDSIEEFFLIDRFQDEQGEDIFRLRPRNATSYTVELQFDKTWQPRVMHVLGEDGDGTRFIFSTFRLHPPLNADTFIMPADLKSLE